MSLTRRLLLSILIIIAGALSIWAPNELLWLTIMVWILALVGVFLPSGGARGERRPRS